MIFPCRKHALTLQLHTAHILSAHESLEQKNKSIQDLKEQKNKLSPVRVFLSRQPPRLLDPWNADLCCSITYFYYYRAQAGKREEQTAECITRGSSIPLPLLTMPAVLSPRICRLMRTETRSAADSPFIPPHLD